MSVPFNFVNKRPPESDFNIDADKVNANFEAVADGSALDDTSVTARLISEEVGNSESLVGAFAAHGIYSNILFGFDVVGAWAVVGSTLGVGYGVVAEHWFEFSSNTVLPNLTLNASNYIYLVKTAGGPYAPLGAGYIEITTTPQVGDRMLM